MPDIIKDVSKKYVHCIINSKAVSNQNRTVRKNYFIHWIELKQGAAEFLMARNTIINKIKISLFSVT